MTPPPLSPAGRRLRLDADLHVPPGPAGLSAAMARAAARGLSDLGFTAHVRPDPGWLDAYVETVRAAGALSRTRIHCGLELTLHPDGRTDLPSEVRNRLSHVDYVVLVADAVPVRLPDLPVPMILAGAVPAALGPACVRAGVAVEVTERRRTPAVEVAVALAAAGVVLTAGSAGTAADVGRWEHVLAVAAALAPVPHPS